MGFSGIILKLTEYGTNRRTDQTHNEYDWGIKQGGKIHDDAPHQIVNSIHLTN